MKKKIIILVVVILSIILLAFTFILFTSVKKDLKIESNLTFCSKKSLTSKVGDELRLLMLG